MCLKYSPLARADALIERGIPPSQWPDDVLNAFCDVYCQHLRCLTEAQINALVEADDDAIPWLYEQFTGQPWPA